MSERFLLKLFEGWQLKGASVEDWVHHLAIHHSFNIDIHHSFKIHLQSHGLDATSMEPPSFNIHRQQGAGKIYLRMQLAPHRGDRPAA